MASGASKRAWTTNSRVSGMSARTKPAVGSASVDGRTTASEPYVKEKMDARLLIFSLHFASTLISLGGEATTTDQASTETATNLSSRPPIVRSSSAGTERVIGSSSTVGRNGNYLLTALRVLWKGAREDGSAACVRDEQEAESMGRTDRFSKSTPTMSFLTSPGVHVAPGGGPESIVRLHCILGSPMLADGCCRRRPAAAPREA